MTRARSPSPDTNEVSAGPSAEEPTSTSPAPSSGMSITRFQFAVMGLVLMSEALCTTMLFPFVGLFVARLAADGTDVSAGTPPMGNATAGIHRTLNNSLRMQNISTIGNSSACGGSPCAGVTEDGRSSAGYYAGLLVGMFQLSQFCFAPRWGRLGDIIGRKPVFMTGLILSGFVVLAFGCSQSILMAMIIRFIHGGVNANASVAKTYVAEVSTKEAQAKLFGMMSLSWSVGGFIGPSVGGILYDPANSKHLLWMGVLQESFLGRNPALLPCAFAALYSWSVCILCAIALKESNPKATGYAAYLKRVLPQSCVGFFSGDKASQSEEGEDEPLELQDVMEDDEEGASPMAPPTVPSSALVNITVGKNGSSPTAKSTASDDDDPPPPFGLRELAHHSVLRRVIPMYMLLCGYNIMFNEGLPLYAIAYRQDEGLGMSSGGVGVTYTMNATVAVIANSQFGRISKMISHLRLWRICNLTFCVVILCYPMLTYIVDNYPDNNIILFGLIGLLSIVRTSSSTWCFSVCMMFVANAAPPRQLGAVTGLGHGCGALSRAFIPIAAAPIFAWSISQHHPFPYNHFLIFELAAVLAMVACAISLRLSDEDVAPRDGAAQQGADAKNDGNPLDDGLDDAPPGVGGEIDVERRGLLAQDSASSEDE